MQPLELKMTAFGPYKNCETIDFRALGDRKLFVISGTTGAGKTTIFDGIFYALYGAASGEDRSDSKGLRSHFADDALPTSVELLFAMKGRTYRVYRQLPYKKTTNKSETPGKVELYEVTDDGDKPLVDQQKATDVSEKIKALVGLTKEQFKQIVMLPQGEFQKLLTSTTANKEEILRKIFKTMKYDDIVTRLKDKRNEAQQALQRAEDLQQHTIRTIHQSFPIRDDSALAEVLTAEYIGAQRLVEALEQEERAYTAQLSAQQQAYEQAIAQHSALQQERATAIRYNAELAEYEQLVVELERLKQQQSDIDKLSKRCNYAEKAQRLAPYDEQFHTLNQHKKALEQRVPTLEEQLHTAHRQHEQCTRQYEQKIAAKAQVPALEQALRTWQPLVAMYERVDESKRQQQQFTQRVKQQRHGLAELTAAKQVAVDAFQRQKDRYEDTLQAIRELPTWQQRVFEEEKKVTAYRQVAQLTGQVQTLAQTLEQARTQHDIAQQQYEATRQKWLQNKAYLLAQDLVDGEACPVCGSTHHTHPATLRDDVDEQLLESQRAHYEQQQRAYYSTEREWQLAKQQLVEAQTSCAALAVDSTVVYTDERYKQSKAQLEKRLQAQQQVAQQQTTLQQLEQQCVEVEQQYQALKEQLTASEQQLRTTTVLLEEQQQQLPSQYATKAELVAYLNEVTQQKTQLEQQFETARKQLEQATQTLKLTENNHTHLMTQIDEAAKNLAEAQQKFKERVLAEFENSQQYREMKQYIPQLPQLRQQLEAFAQQLYATTQACHKRAHLANKQRVDVQAIDEKLHDARLRYEQLFAAWQQTQQYAKNAVTLIEQLRAQVAEIDALERRATHIIALYDLLRGNNEQRMSFERYLQIEYLEQIIEAANERLQPLSNGQFLLQRSERLESHGKQSGLGLDIYDAYTGQTRDVKTMSGGEKFNAALCLALGISDIIQSYRGQVEIDTMFIDEGFGTLDEEALAKAVDTLIELQKSGRMIGVISHVAGLKEAIPAVLEVKKMREGYSHTTFHIE